MICSKSGESRGKPLALASPARPVPDDVVALLDAEGVTSCGICQLLHQMVSTG
jgi:hypothetical protein